MKGPGPSIHWTTHSIYVCRYWINAGDTGKDKSIRWPFILKRALTGWWCISSHYMPLLICDQCTQICLNQQHAVSYFHWDIREEGRPSSVLLYGEKEIFQVLNTDIRKVCIHWPNTDFWKGKMSGKKSKDLEYTLVMQMCSLSISWANWLSQKNEAVDQTLTDNVD